MVNKVLERVGWVGFLSLVVILGAVVFHTTARRALEDELRALEQSIRHARQPVAAARDAGPVAQMGVFYRFFEQPVAAHEWLAKLHAIGRAVGVELPSAEYRTLPTGTRITRYQLTLPLKASYSQGRAFMANALNEIPVLSVEQASFRRTGTNDALLEIEIVMTLHLLEL